LGTIVWLFSTTGDFLHTVLLFFLFVERYVVVRDAASLTAFFDLSFYVVHRAQLLPWLFARFHFTHHSECNIHTSVFFLVDYIDGIVNFTAIACVRIDDKDHRD
jgi:hypothetical protein